MISIFCSPNSELLEARVPQEDVGKLYDRTAWFYDIWASLTESKAQKRAIEIAEVQNKTTILDVAVGTGRLLRKIVKQNPDGKNYGIDISEGMLAKAKMKLSKLGNQIYSLEIGSAFDIRMDDGSVDILFNNYMFDLISFDQMDNVINEFARVLKPSGKLVLVNMTKAEQFGAGLYERIYRISPPLMGGCRGVQMFDLLTEHGFKVITREYVQQMLFPSEVILATK
mgnify:FL=1